MLLSSIPDKINQLDVSIMKISNWKSAVEFVGIAGILIGMFVVYAELQKNSTIARAELNIFVNQQYLDVTDHFSDPKFIEIYIKDLDSAASLTAAERRRLSEFYQGIANIFGY